MCLHPILIWWTCQICFVTVWIWCATQQLLQWSLPGGVIWRGSREFRKWVLSGRYRPQGYAFGSCVLPWPSLYPFSVSFLCSNKLPPQLCSLGTSSKLLASPDLRLFLPAQEALVKVPLPFEQRESLLQDSSEPHQSLDHLRPSRLKTYIRNL